MKKLAKAAAAAAVLAAAAQGLWAADYKGDLQLDLGFRSNKVECDIDWGGSKDSGEDTTGAFTVGLTNYNLFEIESVPMLSVGFMDALTGHFGEYMGFDFLIGPAVGVNLFDVVKFQCAFGLSLGVFSMDDNGDGSGDNDYSSGCVGFGVDVQAKFIPAKRVSPLLGFRYEFDSMGDDKPLVDVTMKSVAIYCGFGINFGI